MHNKLPGNNNLSVKPPLLRQRTQSPIIGKKKQVLVWSDCVLATTGFGTVSRYILHALYNTGKYEIDQLSINHTGEFYDKNRVPYCLMPAKLGNPEDPYGNQMFINALQRKEYDIVLVINDTFVVEEVARHIAELRQSRWSRGMKPFDLVYYYPVDCRLLPTMSTMIKEADRAVAYTNFAKESSLAVGIEPTDVIYHGTDVDSFHAISPQEKTAARKKYLGVDDDDKFLLVNINRNSLRKDIARCILAFSEFRKEVPNSMMYVHAKVEDGAGGHPVDLRVPLAEVGLDIAKDVVFPAKYSPAKGFPVKVLNELYNCGDAYFTTHLGEGWGLTIAEAMACGVPVIAPNNTTAPEMLAANEPEGKRRAYAYKCKERIYIDNSGYRPVGRMEDILEQMWRCHQDWKTDKVLRKKMPGVKSARQQIIESARSFTEEYSWDQVCKQWIKLFSTLGNQVYDNTKGLEL